MYIMKSPRHSLAFYFCCHRGKKKSVEMRLLFGFSVIPMLSLCLPMPWWNCCCIMYIVISLRANKMHWADVKQELGFIDLTIEQEGHWFFMQMPQATFTLIGFVFANSSDFLIEEFDLHICHIVILLSDRNSKNKKLEWLKCQGSVEQPSGKS